MTDANSKAGFLHRAEHAGRMVENAALTLILSGMILLASARIFLRIFMHSGIPWGNEALQLMVLWVAMLGAVVASRENRHISIDVLSSVLPEALKVWSAALVHAFTAVVSLSLAWYSWEFVAQSWEYQDRLLDLPAWLFQSILPIAFLLIGYRYGIWFLRQLRELPGRVNKS